MKEIGFVNVSEQDSKIGENLNFLNPNWLIGNKKVRDEEDDSESQ